MQQKKILATGLTGLVGSRIVELLHGKYAFENVSRSTGVDITNREQITKAISESDAEIVLHLAAKTHVDGCEEDKEKGQDGEAWQINVVGTENVAKACEASGKKLIYVSTDFVFDGEKESYTEEDSPNPVNWYGWTKYEGENRVQRIQTPWLILRIAYPYRAVFEKIDFLRAMKGRLESGKDVMAVTDHFFTPTFIDDFVPAFDALITKDLTGIYHTVGSEALTPFAAATEIATIFQLDKSLLHETTRAEYFNGKAERPFCLALKNGKIEALGVHMRTFTQGLAEIKKQQL